MKSRFGFVANSSSSAFVLIVTKAGHEEALKKLNVYQRDVASYAMEESILLGLPVMVFGELSIMDYGFWEDATLPWKEEYEDLGDDGPSEAFYQYQEALPEGSVVFEWSESQG